MSKHLSLHLNRLKFSINVGFSTAYHYGKRTFLSQAYRCDEAWSKRLDSALLRNIKMDQYFIDTDKKFGSKNLVSGVDIDLFANSVQDVDQLDELEHLLYRFRRTKRAVELMDSTTYAVVRIFLQEKQYEALLRILENPENYGIFPDSCSYNILMDTFIKENMLKEAMHIAVLMMLQEDFSNEISSLLALYSCHMYMKETDLASAKQEEAVPEEKEEYEDEEEQLVRVPFLRNPFFDDHFQLSNLQHLVGKTLFLAGRSLEKDVLGRSCQLLGLGMYEKWNDALQLVSSWTASPVLLSSAVEEFKKYSQLLKDENLRKQFEDLFSKLQEGNKIKVGDLGDHLEAKLQNLSALEESDIILQKKWFSEWEQKRKLSLEKQNLEAEVEQRLKTIAEKRNYLYWKEKQVFFFENEEKLLSEYEQAKQKTSQIKTDQPVDSYIPPEIVKRPLARKTRYQKLALVKKL